MRNLFVLLAVLCLSLPASVLADDYDELRHIKTVLWPQAYRTQDVELLDRILADPALTRAHLGLVVQVAETGEVLYERDGEKLFVPASNTKIVTAAVALDALGPAYRWRTSLVADGDISDGVLNGDLWIVGGGDPQLGREAVASWPELLRRAGIRRIAGDVIGDDRAFGGPQWGEGWYWHEVFASWAAGVSALQVWPNTVRARLLPGARVGDPARFELRRPGPALRVLSWLGFVYLGGFGLVERVVHQGHGGDPAFGGGQRLFRGGVADPEGPRQLARVQGRVPARQGRARADAAGARRGAGTG